ncbi:hypothetical protein H0Z09_09350 [Pseudomonas sp. SWRI18]|nr:hypothetical protein [Pseudomonas sp. SWRI18]
MLIAPVFLAVGTVLVIRQVIAQRATCGTAQSRTDRRSRRAAQAIAYQRAARRADPTAYGGFRSIALLGTDCSAGCATQAGAYGCASGTAKLLADDVAECTTDSAAERRCTISGRHRSLRDQNTQDQGG